jgi:hypothetical protein
MVRTRGSRVAAFGAALLLVGGGLVAGSAGAAATVDISLDFTAAAPLTYDHSTGGGAYDNRSVGRTKDIVESLEGSDFRCGDIVTFLTRVTAGGSVAANATIEIDFEHLADTTGQSGVGFSEIVRAQINAGNVGGEGPGGADLGIRGGGSPVAALTAQSLTAPLFTQKAVLRSTVRISGIGPNTSTVLRRVAPGGPERGPDPGREPDHPVPHDRERHPERVRGGGPADHDRAAHAHVDGAADRVHDRGG